MIQDLPFHSLLATMGSCCLLTVFAVGCASSTVYDAEPTTMVSSSGTFEITFPDKIIESDKGNHIEFICGDPNPERMLAGIRFLAWEISWNNSLEKLLNEKGGKGVLSDKLNNGYKYKKPIVTRHNDVNGLPTFELVAGPKDKKDEGREKYFRELAIYVKSKQKLVYVKVEAKEQKDLELADVKNFFDSLKINE